MKKLIAFTLCAFAALSLAGCRIGDVPDAEKPGRVAAIATIAPAKTPAGIATAAPSASFEAQTEQKASIAAVGDVMLMANQIYDAKTGDSFDFNPVFNLIKPYIQSADIAIANLETPVAGNDTGFSVSGTPQPDGKMGLSYFNAPREILEALRTAGFDVLGTANNHALDKNREGLENTIRNIRAAGLDNVGTNLPGEQRSPVIKEANGIKFAILAYTQGTNKNTGGYSGSELSQAVNFIDDKKVTADIKAAKQAGADIVVVLLHTGIERKTVPEAYETQRAKDYIAAGADILFNSHPHVLQPMAMVEVGEDADARTGFVAYSLGNFISNMDGDDSARSVVAYVDVVKDRRGARITGARYMPTYFYRNGGNYAVLPVAPSSIGSVQNAFGETAAKTAQGAYARTVDFLGTEAAKPEQ